MRRQVGLSVLTESSQGLRARLEQMSADARVAALLDMSGHFKDVGTPPEPLTAVRRLASAIDALQQGEALSGSNAIALQGHPRQLGDALEVVASPTVSALVHAIPDKLDWNNQALLVRETRHTANTSAANFEYFPADWWSSPIGARTVRTTRLLGAAGPVGLWLDEDRTDPEEARAIVGAANDSLRVFEFEGIEDWRSVTERHPRRASNHQTTAWSELTGLPGPWYLPSWDAFHREWDGAHLSVAAFLDTAMVAICVLDGWTILTGWPPDATFWWSNPWAAAASERRWSRVVDAVEEIWVPSP